jgi:heat shock protein HtpX
MDTLNLAEAKLRNRLQSALLVAGMGALLGYLAWIVGGPLLSLLAILMALATWVVTPLISPMLVLRIFGGRPIAPAAAPQLYAMVEALAERASLGTLPRLYYVPSNVMNAFAVGDRNNSVIALSDGLLRRLSLEELAGVLAHEVSHISNHDLRVMSFADLIERFTRLLSLLGQLLLLINLPLLLFSDYRIHWLAIAILIFAPSINALGRLALSRNREFNADLEAARLLGRPEPLASALAKMERFQGRILERFIGPGERLPDPSLLRTHPPTKERIRRLLALRERPQHPPLVPGTWERPPTLLASAPLRPRWHRNGLWY